MTNAAPGARNDDSGLDARADAKAAGLRSAGRWAMIGGGALAVAAALALWASEGARVFADAAFAAVLACL